MEFLSSPEFQAALASLVLIIATGLATFITKNVVDFVKSKATAEQLANLTTISNLAVIAAEQGFIAGFIRDRKASAVALVNIFLLQAGITGVNAQQIEAAIEAAVYTELEETASNDLVLTDRASSGG